MYKISVLLVLLVLLVTTTACRSSSERMGLLLSPQGVKEIRASLGKLPLFDESFHELKKVADEALASTIDVPVPRDAGGGFTHERHKKNYYEMQAAGILYQITKDKKYAEFVKQMLFEYAKLYPTLDLHPVVRSRTPGKLFWQALNEAVWLVHVSQAYDCIYNYLSKEDRTFLEKNLFYPMTEFLSNGNQANYDVFNSMHNHGTWATAAVGMIGYAMGDKNLTDMALWGSKKDGQTGFIRQLDFLFSPDGYFNEGPYYQRYSIWPFMTFAEVIQRKQPELNIFEYRDGILFKAVDLLLQSSYNGVIFYLNNSLTKTFKTQEIVYALNIAFKNNPTNKSLLEIAEYQQRFTISDAGIRTARAHHKEKNRTPFVYRSLLMRDGPDGTQGGIAIFRSSAEKNHTCLTFKATSHGSSHGHYDKLSITLHDNGNAILSDYGSVRFLNIEPKFGGHYTKENFTWAMQTIAHNTVTVDSTSHFKADINVSSKHHSEILYSDFQNQRFQIVSGLEQNAYPDIVMHRTVSMQISDLFEFPIVLDVFRLQSKRTNHVFDLPFYYQGHMVSTNFPYTKQTEQLNPLGRMNGYQHLWVEATGKPSGTNSVFTWIKGNRFYSITTLTDNHSTLKMTRTGAGDPYFNLRYEPAFMIRQKTTTNQHTFVSVIEPHGSYDLNKEITSGHKSQISSIQLHIDNPEISIIEITNHQGQTLIYAQANKDFNLEKTRQFTINGKEYEFKGNYFITQ